MQRIRILNNETDSNLDSKEGQKASLKACMLKIKLSFLPLNNEIITAAQK